MTTTSDGGDGSLRAAIAAANAARPTQPIRIQVPAGEYTLSLCGADDTNAAGDLDLNAFAAVQIVATGSEVVIRQTCAGERVLDVLGAGLVTLSGLTITGGSVVEQDPAVAARGGGVRTAGDLKLENTDVRENSTTAAPGGKAQGGALFVGGSLEASGSYDRGRVRMNTAIVPGSAGGAAEGGGIYVVGGLSLATVIIAENTARGGYARGGGIAQDVSSTAVVSVRASDVGGNIAEGGASSNPGTARGGGLALSGPATLTDTDVFSNVARGGAYSGTCDAPSPIYCFGYFPGGDALGGAITSATNLTHTRGIMSFNETVGGPGVWIRMGGSFPIAGSSGGAIEVPGEVTLQGGTYESHGVLLHARTASVTDSRFRLNSIALSADEHIEVARAHFTDNNQGIVAGSVAVDSATFVENTLPVRATGVARIANTTIVNNRAGIEADTIELIHATISDNEATPLRAARLRAQASIVTAFYADQPVCTPGIVVELSAYNWFNDESCGLQGVGDRQSFPLYKLHGLGDYGGAVWTRPPVPGSVLIDAVPAQFCALEADARGVPRPQGAGCDLGAVETLPISGVGATDLAISFEPHPPVREGELSTWKLVVHNRGPNAALPFVRVFAPGEVGVDSATAPGASCDYTTCQWVAPLAAGESATISLTGTLWTAPSGNLHWEADVTAQNLLPPTDDDHAELVTPFIP